LINTFLVKGTIDSTIDLPGQSCDLGQGMTGSQLTRYPELEDFSIIYVMGAPTPLWEMNGNWVLQVGDGAIKDFYLGFTMQRTDGSNLHYHQLTNLVVNRSIDLNLSKENKINGLVDFK
jgi:hypothetical protein